jgi:hypothetical protein
MPKGNPFRNNAPLIPGNPGNSGGKKGRSGRKPKGVLSRRGFVEWCESLLTDETVRAVAEARAKAGDTKVLEFAAKYSQSLPAQKHNVETTLIVKAQRE